MSTLTLWQDTLAYAQHVRRVLHQHPELTWAEEQTAVRIRESLSEMKIPWRVCARLGTIATLNENGTGTHIALRADIDALPIHEQTGVAWQSQTEGVMHACGHDGHCAALLATAKWLKASESKLAGPVTLLFQPAEEGGHGAREMIAGGALQRVDKIFGWHNWPAIGFGELLCPAGTVMCGNGTFSVKLIGKGGHASQPEKCRDPVLAAAAVTIALQQMVARRSAPQAPMVLSVTSIEAPSALTVIPETADLAGSFRFADPADRERIESWLTQICEDTARSYGVQCSVDIQPRYAPTLNSEAEANEARCAWESLYGSESLARSTPAPIMASEDFSYYLQKIPGAYALIGADDGPEHQHACHSAHYDFNDRLLEKVVRWYSQIVGVATPDTS